jgi:hypothetical protein
MKKVRSSRRLKLNTETLLHLRNLALPDLRNAYGGANLDETDYCTASLCNSIPCINQPS